MRIVALGTVILAISAATQSVATPSEESDSVGRVEASALQAFLKTQPDEITNATARIDLEAWLARLAPWDELCARVVNSPWIIGTSDVVRPIPDGSGYWINVPLPAYGLVEYLDDGAPTVNATQDGETFTMDDIPEYLEAVGIFYGTDHGIGATSYVQITVRPLEGPLIC